MRKEVGILNEKRRKKERKKVEIKGKNKYVFTQVETAIMDNGYN